jgi:AefR-like transcriptional repressor, C-terminal domain
MDELFNTLALYFSAMQGKGELREFDPAYGARAFHGMVYSYFHMEEVLMCRGSKAADLEKVMEEFVKIFVSGTNK